MTHKTKSLNLAIRSGILTDDRRKDLFYYGRDTMDVLNVENINPEYNGRTIPYDAVEYERPIGIMEQIASVMDWMVHEELDAPEEVKIESLMINRWGVGQALSLHADNAYWNPGQPNHLQPNYTSWRTHSAIYYINEEFEGGNLFFENGIEIVPSADSIIAFSAGLDSVHGVREITAGERWTVAAWFTDDPEHYHALAQPWNIVKNDGIRSHLKHYTG